MPPTPDGGCVVSDNVKPDGTIEPLACLPFPHQPFIYGHFNKEWRELRNLDRITLVVA